MLLWASVWRFNSGGPAQVLIDDNSIDIDPEQVTMIKNMINGVRPVSDSGSDRGFLYEVVANKRNGIDVDKASAPKLPPNSHDR